MKKSYLKPQTLVEVAECEMLIAASILDPNSTTPSVELTAEEYSGEFSTKEYSFGDDF